MPLQQVMNINLAPGVAGQRVSTNPFAYILADEGQLVAGENGLTVARFGWRDATNPYAINNTGTGAPLGFIENTGMALTVSIRDEAAMLIPQGKEVKVAAAGDYYAKTTTNTTIGQKVFAKLTDGTIQTGAAGATIAGYAETDFYASTEVIAGELVKISTWSKK